MKSVTAESTKPMGSSASREQKFSSSELPALVKCFIDAPLDLGNTTSHYSEVVSDLEKEIAAVTAKRIQMDASTSKTDAIGFAEHSQRSGFCGVTPPAPKDDSPGAVASASKTATVASDLPRVAYTG